MTARVQRLFAAETSAYSVTTTVQVVALHASSEVVCSRLLTVQSHDVFITTGILRIT